MKVSELIEKLSLYGQDDEVEIAKVSPVASAKGAYREAVSYLRIHSITVRRYRKQRRVAIVVIGKV